MRARHPRLVTSYLTPRRVLTYALLISSLGIVLLAQASFRRPSLWRWVNGNSESESTSITTTLQSQSASESQPARMPYEWIATSSLFAYLTPHSSSPGMVWGPILAMKASEFVPLPNESRTQSPRRAPYPDMRLLSGAADGEPFLVPPPDAIPELQASAKAQKDAQARYQLLQLVHSAAQGSLDADGRSDVRYQALRVKPDSYRGELIQITGTLVSLGDPMELRQSVAGLNTCYLGLITTDQPNHAYLVLFTELPTELKKLQPQWRQLYLHGVKFTGYFYKVAKFNDPNKKDPWLLPVLVGKTVSLPIRVESSDGWWTYFLVFGLMAAPVILAAIVLPRWFRSREKAQQQVLSRFRSRQRMNETLDSHGSP